MVAEKKFQMHKQQIAIVEIVITKRRENTGNVNFLNTYVQCTIYSQHADSKIDHKKSVIVFGLFR